MLDRRRGIVLPFGGDVFRGKRLFFDGLEALDRLAAQQKEAAVQQDAFGFLDAVAAGAAAGDEEDR